MGTVAIIANMLSTYGVPDVTLSTALTTILGDGTNLIPFMDGELSPRERMPCALGHTAGRYQCHNTDLDLSVCSNEDNNSK